MNPHAGSRSFGKRIEYFFARIKQHFIIFYLINFCGGKDVINKYKEYSLDDVEPISESSPIWTCWWQGENDMPLIVKACYQAMKRYAGKHPVILVTKDNYKEYVDMPFYIIEKQQKGIIDITHFSDILRMMLLSKHGGIWMDSTLLIALKPIDKFISPSEKFWTCHHKTLYNNVAQGGWTSFFLACGKNNPLPSFIADMHLKYWGAQNKLIDYLLLDYTFAIANMHVPSIHEMVEKVPLTSMGPLGKYLNNSFNSCDWEHLCTDYNFHKLTYKIPLQTKNAQGEITYYGHITESFLEQE